MSEKDRESRWLETIKALEKERDLLRRRVQELEEALQGCLSRSRHCPGCGFAEWWLDATQVLSEKKGTFLSGQYPVVPWMRTRKT